MAKGESWLEGTRPLKSGWIIVVRHIHCVTADGRPISVLSGRVSHCDGQFLNIASIARPDNQIIGAPSATRPATEPVEIK